VWLRRVLSGEEKLQLNDATRRAIREGTLISTGAPTPLQLNPSELPFVRSFDDVRRTGRKDMMELPPAVIMLDGLNLLDTPSIAMPFQPTIASAATSLASVNLRQLQVAAPLNTPTAVRPGGVGVSIGFSAESILRYIFWPSERAKVRNRKHATARYTYNQYE
jgi:hypothetical protein